MRSFEEEAGPQAEATLRTLGVSSLAAERLLACRSRPAGIRAADWTARRSWLSVAGCQRSAGLSLTAGRAGRVELASPESLLALRQKKKSSLSYTSGPRAPAINEQWEKARKETFIERFCLADDDDDDDSNDDEYKSLQTPSGKEEKVRLQGSLGASFWGHHYLRSQSPCSIVPSVMTEKRKKSGSSRFLDFS